MYIFNISLWSLNFENRRFQIIILINIDFSTEYRRFSNGDTCP